MSYVGDFAAGDTVDFKFTTRRFSTGAPFTLAGTPAISVYKSNSTTQSTSGITLTADFDTVTGLNHVRIDTTSDGTFYANGSQFDAVITTGTVDSVSVVGEVIGRFTLRAQASLYPTTAGRTLDVSAGGEAGLDWANIGSPTTSVTLSGTTVKTATDVETDTQDLQSRLPAALVSGRIDASVGAMASDTLTATALAASAVSEIQSGLSTLDAAGVRSAVGLASANLDTQLDALPTATENADALLKRDWTAVSGEAARSVLNALRFLRNKFSLSGTDLVVCKEDDATTAWSATVTTDAAADPITGSDPS